MKNIIAGGSIALVAGLSTLGFVGTAHAETYEPTLPPECPLVEDPAPAGAAAAPSSCQSIEPPTLQTPPKFDTQVSPPRAVSTVDSTVAGALPSTGGPDAAMLAGGALLLAAGGAAVVVARRRQTS